MDGSGAPETPMSSAESEPAAQVIVPADIDPDSAPNPEAGKSKATRAKRGRLQVKPIMPSSGAQGVGGGLLGETAAA